MQNFAVLVDLNSVRLSFSMFEKALAEVEKQAYISFFKFYNYDNKRNREFYRFIASRNAETAVPLRNRRKVNIDIRQAIDAVKLCCTSVDGVFMICSEIDSLQVITALKGINKKVILGVVSPTTTSKQASGIVLLERELEEENSETLDSSKEENVQKSNKLNFESEEKAIKNSDIQSQSREVGEDSFDKESSVDENENIPHMTTDFAKLSVFSPITIDEYKRGKIRQSAIGEVEKNKTEAVADVDDFSKIEQSIKTLLGLKSQNKLEKLAIIKKYLDGERKI